MNARTYHEELHRQGVRVAARGDNLIVDPPPTGWTSDLRLWIAAHKVPLLAVFGDGTPMAVELPTVVQGPRDVDALVAAVRGSRRVGLTAGFGPEGTALCVIVPSGALYAVDVRRTEHVAALAEVLRGVRVVGHDLLPVLAAFGSGTTCEPATLFDTMVASKLLDAGRHLSLAQDEYFSLDAAAHRLLGIRTCPPDDMQSGDAGAVENMAILLAPGMRVLFDLEDELLIALRDAQLEETAALENALIPAVVGMSLAGVPIDRTRWDRLVADWRAEAEVLRVDLCGALGIANLGDGAAVSEAMRGLGFSVEMMNSGAATDDDRAVFEKLARYRQINGFVVSIGSNVQEQMRRSSASRVMPQLNQLGCASGRFSCSNPNLLGLPRDRTVRGCVEATVGNKLIDADYAAIELRVLADMTQDEHLLDVCRAGDPHRRTASIIAGVPEHAVTEEQRRQAKAVNFGFAFGMGAEKFRDYARKHFGLRLSIADAEAFKQQFLSAYPGVARWQSEIRRAMPQELRSSSGRLREFDDSDEAYCKRLSHPVQGTAADGMKRALVLLHGNRRFREIGGHLLLVIHDEILAEAPEANAAEAMSIVVECMKAGMAEYLTTVPIVVVADVRSSWAKPASSTSSPQVHAVGGLTATEAPQEEGRSVINDLSEEASAELSIAVRIEEFGHGDDEP